MSSGRILHIAEDEKFINAAHYLFEQAFPGDNKFIIVKPPANPSLMYLNSQFNAEYLVLSESIINQLLQETKKAEVVILHRFDKIKAALFLASSEKHKFVGNIFGAEIYNKRISDQDFLKPKSRTLKQMLEKQQDEKIIERLKKLYKSIRYKSTTHLFDEVNTKEALYQLEYVGLLSRHTYLKFIERNIIHPKCQMIPFSYYPLEYILKDESLRADGPNILLGNSASITNNHVEAIDLLKNMELTGRKIFTPLSYGYGPYADAIESYGSKHLADNFAAIRSFIPLQEYNKLISSCQFVVMNHHRSQAMGNIITSLYLGAKVFVNKTDAYYYFKKIGCHIFLIEECLAKKGSASLVPLTQEEIYHNRKVLSNELSTKSLVNRLRTGINNLLGNTQLKHVGYCFLVPHNTLINLVSNTPGFLH